MNASIAHAIVMVEVLTVMGPGRQGALAGEAGVVADVPVRNASFEARSLDDCQFTLPCTTSDRCSVNGLGVLPDWVVTACAPDSGRGAAGTFNPVTPADFDDVPDGENVAFVNGLGRISQVLEAEFEALTEYTVSVYVGARRNYSGASWGFELFAGDTRLASTGGSWPSGFVGGGRFFERSLRVCSRREHPAFGSPLRIVLSAGAETNSQVSFDDVRATSRRAAKGTLVLHAGACHPEEEGWRASYYESCAVNDGALPNRDVKIGAVHGDEGIDAWMINDTTSAMDVSSNGGYRWELGDVELAAILANGFRLSTCVRASGDPDVSGAVEVEVDTGERRWVMAFGSRETPPSTVTVVRLLESTNPIAGAEITIPEEGAPSHHCYDLVFDPGRGTAALHVDGSLRHSGYRGGGGDCGNPPLVFFGSGHSLGRGAGYYGRVELVQLEGDASFVRGDCNVDGGLDVSDALCVLGWLFLGGPEPKCVDAADANDSGGFLPDVSDAVYLLGWLFIGGPALPLPGLTGCGPDLTPDELGCAGYEACQ